MLVASNKSFSNTGSMLKGNKYRITILSERLVRLEYDPEGKFCDEKTELAIDRDFPVTEYKVQQDQQYQQDQLVVEHFII